MGGEQLRPSHKLTQTSAPRMPAADCQGEHGARRRMDEDSWGAGNASRNKRAAKRGQRRRGSALRARCENVRYNKSTDAEERARELY